MTASSTDWMGLSGSRIVVSGAARGIGLTIAETFHTLGGHVVLMGRDSKSLAEAATRLDPRGRTAIAVTADVTDDAALAEAARRIEADFGPVDTVINNAAVMRPGTLDAVDLADWTAQIDVNVTGALRTARAFGNAMIARGRGAFVHVASIAGSHPQPFSGAYSVSKTGLVMLSRQLAVEWGPHGIRSNVVSPGLVRAPMSEAFYQAPGILEKRQAVVPLRRIGTPDDMAAAAAFLASPRASYINGQEIIVDGGFTDTMMTHVPRPGY